MLQQHRHIQSASYTTAPPMTGVSHLPRESNIRLILFNQMSKITFYHDCFQSINQINIQTVLICMFYRSVFKRYCVLVYTLIFDFNIYDRYKKMFYEVYDIDSIKITVL